MTKYYEKSPYTSEIRPIPAKSKVKANRVIITTKDTTIGRKPGRKAPAIDFSRPRWSIHYKGGRYVSNIRELPIAIHDFIRYCPGKAVTMIVPIGKKRSVYKRGIR